MTAAILRDLARAKATFQARTLHTILTEGRDMNIPGYDAWKLQGPDEDRHEIGHEDGQPCNRVHEPDEDAPRGYRPKPCKGVMDYDECGCCIQCDTCGEYA